MARQYGWLYFWNIYDMNDKNIIFSINISLKINWIVCTFRIAVLIYRRAGQAIVSYSTNMCKWAVSSFWPNWPAVPPPSPGMVIFPEKNLPPFFFLEIRPLLGEKNYTWSHLKIYSFFAFIMASIIAIFPQDLGRSGYFQSCPNSCRYEISTPDQV